jgi:hypothetical protein
MDKNTEDRTLSDILLDIVKQRTDSQQAQLILNAIAGGQLLDIDNVNSKVFTYHRDLAETNISELQKEYMKKVLLDAEEMVKLR